MPSVAIAIVLLLVAYLIGAIPFGYLIGRFKGVNLFQVGSGNIGATNAGRVLGWKFGGLVFVLDFLKGALPVACIVPLARLLDPTVASAFESQEVLRVAAAALSFLGHLFPIYLGFRGGKGVATGAGTIFVLVPGPAALAILTWVVVLFASRLVALASLAAAVMLVVAYLIGTPAAFAPASLPITIYLLAGVAMVIVKHRGNVKRLRAGTENHIGDFAMRQPVLRGLHVLALGLWFGGAAFFSFVAAPLIFQSFTDVVNSGPSDRTANQAIVPENASPEQKKDLASSLAGAAVGPIFPWYFGMQIVCGFVALFTAQQWWNAEGKRPIHRWRVYLIGAGLLAVMIASPVASLVSELRVLRYSSDPGTAAASRANFGAWHMVSLALSFVTVTLAGIALALAGRLPETQQTGS